MSNPEPRKGADEDADAVRRAQAARATFQALRDNWPARLELINLQAKIAKVRFDALRKEGFEVSEALELCVKDWRA